MIKCNRCKKLCDDWQLVNLNKSITYTGDVFEEYDKQVLEDSNYVLCLHCYNKMNKMINKFLKIKPSKSKRAKLIRFNNRKGE